VKACLFATYRAEYDNFTHMSGESINSLFQRFTVIVNNMRANVTVLPYDDHDRAMKLLHSLDRTVWGAKVEAILESNHYETLTIDVIYAYQTSFGLQADRILHSSQGTVFPLSVNPRYRICRTNVWCKNQSNKATNTLIFERLLLSI
jgi:hypothetical protein